MRITGGEARGRKIIAPAGVDTRPTGDKVKAALFNIICSRIGGAVVLDLFSGSGALALESISRGAQSAVAVEMAPQAAQIIRRNIASIGYGDRVELIQGSWNSALNRLEGARFSIVFLDPPYHMQTVYGRCCDHLHERVLLEDGALVVFEHKSDIKPQVPTVQHFAHIDSRKYSDTTLSFYEYKSV